MPVVRRCGHNEVVVVAVIENPRHRLPRHIAEIRPRADSLAGHDVISPRARQPRNGRIPAVGADDEIRLDGRDLPLAVGDAHTRDASVELDELRHSIVQTHVDALIDRRAHEVNVQCNAPHAHERNRNVSRTETGRTGQIGILEFHVRVRDRRCAYDNTASSTPSFCMISMPLN
jgi:hypothetical protein